MGEGGDMIYVFGCSMTKWHWPTWADWLSQYSDEGVKNLAYPGYGPGNLYWNLINNIGQMGVNDSVIMMWPNSCRYVQWYDEEWVNDNDSKGFFPDPNGKLWFGEDYLGLYRTHPDKLHSQTDNIISLFRDIFHSQQLLNSKNINYKMCFTQNPWIDSRPTYRPKFEFGWIRDGHLLENEHKQAKDIIRIEPVRKLLDMINWEPMIDVIDCLDPTTYGSFWDFYLSEKEYITYSHDTDRHPSSIAHHDYCSKFLNISNEYRDLAIDCSKEAIQMSIPEFDTEDFIASPDKELLNPKFLTMLRSKAK